ncbi:MAG: phosphate/phosphite/phosphonate ABC transporter substrate-binding protein [Geminicoccaceae bacterium]|jgi:phosphonate transport system substrate-binding protein|nr:phosphate/phosphite/phosphonate ABC transporter substrate-binding protein [Geminicoccaceae bacterium]MCB9966457.1 phosphate/phosphite/phosphonate ABC transporter substrate-binding protein [Geminicoccaceae bacterium]HRY23043.1 phosphate/phosphite/phosphonate ABC transporter substrate-binding protein [Geminicoccaceae bacterium]
MRSAPARRDALRLLAASLAMSATPAAAIPQRPAEPPLTFGVFPFLPALEIGRRFGPVSSALAEMLGRPVALQTKTDFEAFRRFLLDGRYDLAFLHPFLYADAASAQDYRPLGRIREDLAAFIVARKEERCASFRDLCGRVLALPPKLSGVAQLAFHELEEQRLLGPGDVQVEYHRTKSSCIHAVISGSAAACALPGFVLSQLKAFAPIELEPKFQTRAVPGLLLAAHGRLGEPMLDQLRDLVIGLERVPAGQSLLAGFGWTGFVPAPPAQYDITHLRGLVGG